MSADRGATSGARGVARQRGIGMLLVLAVLVVLGTSLLTAVLSSSQVQRQRQRATADALATAKRALIAYAAAFAETKSATTTLNAEHYVPGVLPCPELTAPASASAEGRAATPTCGGSAGLSLLGRLPWAELSIDPPRDGAGQCLWYAVTHTFKRKVASTYQTISPANVLNWDTPGMFDIVQADASSAAPVYLAGPEDAKRAVAVIFAPGAPLPGKSPEPHANAVQCRGSYVADDYLDSADGINNASAPGTSAASFVVAEEGATFNDRLVYITAQEIFDEIERQQSFRARIRETMRHAAECIVGFARYHQTLPGGSTDDQRLPWAAALAMNTVGDYSNSNRYLDGTGRMAGRLPFIVRRSCEFTRGLTSCPGSERALVAVDTSNYCTTWNNRDEVWYHNWKDQMFYAVAANHAPGTASSTDPCPTCLKVNGSGNYAAVLMFSGRALSAQKRSTLIEKANIANYLEGRNDDNDPNNSGDSDYESGSTTTTFNDVLVCVDEGLNVIDPCPAGT